MVMVSPRRGLVGLLFTIAFCGLGSESHGIILFPKGQDEPIMGRLMGREGPKYTVKFELPSGETLIREFFEAELDSVLITVSPERLATLSPHAPEAYRDYAEELAEKRKDPDARDEARRLYLIAAYLAPDTLGRSCLLGMLPLADDESQERRFRAMAYLLDPQHDRKLLSAAKPGPPVTDQDNEDGERILLNALREFRQGNRALARTLVNQDRVKRVMARYEHIMTFDEFYRAESETPPETLYKILKLELRLARGPAAANDSETVDAKAWSQIAKQGDTPPVPLLSLETLIPGIDPKQCVYRSGRWVVPEAGQVGP